MKSARTAPPTGVPSAPGQDDLVLVPCHRLEARVFEPDVVVLAFDLEPPTAEHHESLLTRLTPRQQSVIDLALKGASDLVIASALGLSRHTVSNQLRRAYQRLGVSTRTEMCALFHHELPPSPSR